MGLDRQRICFLSFVLQLRLCFCPTQRKKAAFKALPFRHWKLLHGINQLLTAYGFFFFLFLSLTIPVVVCVELMFGLAALQNHFRAFCEAGSQNCRSDYSCNWILPSVCFSSISAGKC